MIISIIGCGWLGFPLAQRLLNEGHTVKGSTTSEDKYQILKKNGIEPYLLSIPDTIDAPENSGIWESDLLILNIPPGRGQSDVDKTYPEKIGAVRDQIEKSDGSATIKRIIFASSTSVYPPEEGIFGEEDTKDSSASRPSGTAILKAEKMLLDSSKFDTVILRFGGLYGYNRHPIHYMKGRKNMSSPLKPVNLIHQDDCIKLIRQVVESDIKNEIFNAVSDGHPPRKTFYQSAARHYGVEPPSFDSSSDSCNRIISNKKIKEELGFTFIYPNPLDHTA